MRIASILMALFVVVALYFLVLQRDALFALVGREAPAEGETAEPTTPTAAPEAPPAAAEAPAAPRVAVVALESKAQPVDRAVLVRGRTEATRSVAVRAETSGLIVNDPLRKGALVQAGDLLCSIDPGTREASLAEAEARLREAQARLPESRARVTEAQARLTEAEINDRAAQSLSESGFAAETRVAATAAAVSAAQAQVETSRAGLESAQSAVESAEAAVAAAEKEIERLTMVAPFDGLLEGDTAELGALMQPGQLCATVIQLDPIKLVGFVPEAQVDRVVVDAPAQARLISGGTVRGTVTYVARSADEETRTFRVEIEVANPALTIRDGQTADIAIASEGAEAHLLPASALTLDDDGRLGVRIAVAGAEGDEAAFTPVEVLRDSLNGIYLTGLPKEARVIVVGQEFVTDGVPIEVTLRAPAADAAEMEVLQ